MNDLNLGRYYLDYKYILLPLFPINIMDRKIINDVYNVCCFVVQKLLHQQNNQLNKEVADLRKVVAELQTKTGDQTTENNSMAEVGIGCDEQHTTQ